MDCTTLPKTHQETIIDLRHAYRNALNAIRAHRALLQRVRGNLTDQGLIDRVDYVLNQPEMREGEL
jgi:hypothetical protein